MRLISRVFFGALLALGLLGVTFTGAALYARLLYFSLAVISFSWLWAQVALWGIHFSRHARLARASVGDLFEENFEIQNSLSLPRLWVEVNNQSDLPQSAGSRLLTILRGKENRTYLARTWITQRGAYTLGPTTLTSGDPFGLFAVKSTFPAAESLLVLPLIVPIRDFPSPQGLLPGGKAIRQKSAEITPHAVGVREYATGDPLKRIHWPSTARRARLMVKDFEQDPQSETWLFLDAQRTVHATLSTPEEAQIPFWQDWMLFGRRPKFSLPPSTMEYGVTVCASLAHYFLQQRSAVGLVTAGPHYTVIPAERSQRQEGKILETLAFVQPQGDFSLVSLVETHAPLMPFGSTALLVTPCGRSEILLAVELLMARGLHPMVVMLMSASFGGSEFNESLIEQLQARAIPVCTIAKDANLGETLSAFAAQHRHQENILWPKSTSTYSI